MVLLELAPSTVSKHLAVLLQAGLVACRKEGRWRYYRLPGPEAGPEVARSLEWAIGFNERTPQFLADARRVKSLRRSTGPAACCADGEG
jgi:DNA-binding transcriptional ArsR family regulator